MNTEEVQIQRSYNSTYNNNNQPSVQQVVSQGQFCDESETVRTHLPYPNIHNQNHAFVQETALDSSTISDQNAEQIYLQWFSNALTSWQLELQLSSTLLIAINE